jgi:hypothetical protein
MKADDHAGSLEDAAETDQIRVHASRGLDGIAYARLCGEVEYHRSAALNRAAIAARSAMSSWNRIRMRLQAIQPRLLDATRSVVELSTPHTRSPRSSSRCATVEPMNPAAPVIITYTL